MNEGVQVFGIRFFVGRIEGCAVSILEACTGNATKLNRCVSATGAHGLVIAKKSEEFNEILKGNYLNLPDGVPVTWVGWLKGARGMKRCYGPDLFAETMRISRTTSIGHFFCGGKEGVAEELERSCSEKFGNENCVGTFAPPFREMKIEEWQDLAGKINAAKPDIVWIGLSTPKQEKFAYTLSKMINVHFLVTVGAAFDFHTDRVRQAPRFVQRIGMEWFFRLIMEPVRLFPRYVEVVPKFIAYAAQDVLFRGSKTRT